MSLDDCVHCGFCLPTCPTYDLWSEEMDSPRGRIVLMKELAAGELSAELITHIDNCLGCMSCVTACPSGVQYDVLINEARAEIERRHVRPRAERLKRRAIFATFPHHRRLAALKPLLPFAKLGRRLPGLAELTRLAPERPPRVKAIPEVVPGDRGRVGFLQGCVQRAYFPHVNAATVAVLAAEGFEVFSPAAVECCGSLELHSGEADAAGRRAADVEQAFAAEEVIITNAAGCGSGLKEYPRMQDKVRDVTEFLAEHEPRAPRGRIDLKIAYHDACHLAHAQGVREQPRALLRGIPGVELVEPDEWEICCGSAGIYNLTHPDTAAELGRRKAENLLATGAEAIVAANPGCTLQIQAHLRELGHPLPVYHPMELLWTSLTSARTAS
ncbi:MAG: glycolate oxidase iron-sulfur subunit [Solirubrobacteraceae bacterium]|nr:glycolate oxidase iron-sulfur subunit [Solirubrobacteraceae bacterium]